MNKNLANFKSLRQARKHTSYLCCYKNSKGYWDNPMMHQCNPTWGERVRQYTRYQFKTSPFSQLRFCYFVTESQQSFRICHNAELSSLPVKISDTWRLSYSDGTGSDSEMILSTTYKDIHNNIQTFRKDINLVSFSGVTISEENVFSFWITIQYLGDVRNLHPDGWIKTEVCTRYFQCMHWELYLTTFAHQLNISLFIYSCDFLCSLECVCKHQNLNCKGHSDALLECFRVLCRVITIRFFRHLMLSISCGFLYSSSYALFFLFTNDSHLVPNTRSM